MSCSHKQSFKHKFRRWIDPTSAKGTYVRALNAAGPHDVVTELELLEHGDLFIHHQDVIHA